MVFQQSGIIFQWYVGSKSLFPAAPGMILMYLLEALALPMVVISSLILITLVISFSGINYFLNISKYSRKSTGVKKDDCIL